MRDRNIFLIQNNLNVMWIKECLNCHLIGCSNNDQCFNQSVISSLNRCKLGKLKALRIIYSSGWVQTVPTVHFKSLACKWKHTAAAQVSHVQVAASTLTRPLQVKVLGTQWGSFRKQLISFFLQLNCFNLFEGWLFVGPGEDRTDFLTGRSQEWIPWEEDWRLS